MNTYTQKQIETALNILTTVFEDHSNYLALPDDSKAILAEIILRAFKIDPQQ